MPVSAWLVDMGYVVKAASGAFRLDYAAAQSLLATRFGAVRTFLFNSFDERYGTPPGLQRFYNAMRLTGASVSLHPMSGDPRSGDHRQRRVDVDLAAHLVWQASLPEVRHVVLTSGDQDFLPAVRIVRARYEKRLVLYTYRRSVHADLRRAADEQIHFDDHESELSRGRAAKSGAENDALS